ncbi:hypothetical protein MTR67_027228 [Solanum verrucosum]|uniref:Uncharacterized protein n=1 Tax=Solanum verrucosum TaxID=315347 RepID=A0AAF0R4C0_SOLVR|nr:hypothetical protein MTR67_027228 [Solanum verrucosum]
MLGKRNLEKLYEVLPAYMTQHINNIPIGDQESHDFVIWDVTQDCITPALHHGKSSDNIGRRTPLLTSCWEIWRRWDFSGYVVGKFGGAGLLVNMIVFGGPYGRKEMQGVLRAVSFLQCPVRISSGVYTWTKPMLGRIEVNTDGDGSYIQQNNISGIGGMARFKTHDLELDSLVITDMINNKVTNYHMINNKVTNYHKLKGIIRDIIKGINGADMKISHCFREANQVSQFLFKQAFSSGNETFYSFQHLPKEVKGLFQLDRRQLRSIKRSYNKSNFFFES